MITLKRFRQLEAILRERGYGPTIDWTESIQPATTAEDFAERAIYVICNSGMANAAANVIYQRCLAALYDGVAVASVFRHPGKAPAIERIWADREQLFAAYSDADDPIAALEALPWIGAVTALHLAKNLGANVAKPDVHMERLARAENTTTAALCERLSRETDYRVATIDTILWRACADRILQSAVYEAEGWRAAFKP
ncbi:hypothetical protein [Erythrobacter sp.]|uniref:hypothetical protein n=1 Tax=Erythrobacter sp. TaxID=1042 RepID=UPI003C7158FA